MDLTARHIYSLSAPTKELLQNLKDPVHITAYFSTAFPPESRENLTKLYVENSLKDMKAYGGKNIILHFVDPKTDPEKKNEAEKAGIAPLQLNTIKNDAFSLEVGYLGLVISYEDKKEVIPYFANSLSPEYELSTRIRKMTSKDLPAIGIIEGYGVPPLQRADQNSSSMELLAKEIASSYTLTPIKLQEVSEIPKTISTLLLTGISEDISEEKIKVLETFMESGHNMIIAQNFQKLSLEKGIQLTPINMPHLDGFFKKHGVEIAPGSIIDTPGKQIPVAMQQGTMMIRQIIDFPLIPVLIKIPDTLLTKGVQSITIPFSSPLSSPDKKLLPLLTTTSRAQTFSGTGPINPLESKSLFTTGSGTTLTYALMGALAPKENKKRIFALGSSTCLDDQIMQTIQDRSCLDLVMNAIDWTIQDSNLMEVRNKVSEDRPLTPTTTEEKLFYKVLALGLPGILVLLVGISRLVLRNRRMKRIYKA